MKHIWLVVFVALWPVMGLGQALSSTVSPGEDGTFDGPVLAPRHDITDQDWIYYADPAGDDGNACTDALHPCKTFRAAWDKLPDHWAGKARIVLAAGTYTESGEQTFDFGGQLGGGEPLVIQGPMVDSGLGELTITSVATYGSGYVVSVTDSSVSPTLDEYKGYFLRMTTCAAGAGCVGMTRIIKGNSTGGQFDLNLGSTSSSVKPAIGDKFVIEKPGAILSGNNKWKFVANGAGRPVYGYPPVDVILYQVGIAGTSSSASWLFTNSHVAVRKVYIDTTGKGLYAVGASMISDVYGSGITSDNLLGIAQEYGAGLYVKSTTSCASGWAIGIDGPARAWFYALVADNATLSARYHGAVISAGPHLTGCGIQAYGSNITVTSQPYGPLASINGASNGIQLADNSYLDLGSVAGTNTNYGVTIAGNSTLSERSTSAPTITGGTGDVSLGADTLTHANISGGTFYSNPPFGVAFSNAATVDPQLKAGTITATGNISAANFSGSSSGANTGDVTVSAVGSTPNANGATLSGQVLNLEPADATNPGVLTAGAQSIGGAKTFTSDPSATKYIATATAGNTAFEAVANAKLTLGGASLTGQAGGFTWDFPGAIPGVTTYGVNSQQLTTPVNSTFSATTGTLNDGTYCYRVAGVDVTANYTLASTETCLAVSGGAGSNGVIITWGKVTGAVSYRIYGRSTGAELYMATVSAPTLTWTDDGSVTPSGALPTSNTSGKIVSTYLTAAYASISSAAYIGSVSSLVYTASSYNDSIRLAGREASDGAAISWKVSNAQTQLVTPGDLIMAWYNDADTTKVAHVDYLGGFSASSYATTGFSASSTGVISMTRGDSTGTPGNATLDTPSGVSAIAAGNSSIVITNSLVTETTIPYFILMEDDVVCKTIDSVSVAAGAITLNVNGNCNADTNIGWFLLGAK
jgi:hypothetical protein